MQKYSYKGGRGGSEENCFAFRESTGGDLAGALAQFTRRLQRLIKTGAWLVVHTSKVNDTELSAQGWRDIILLFSKIYNVICPSSQ